MAVKPKRAGRRRGGERLRPLAPPEAQGREPGRNGVLRTDSGALRVPEDLVDSDRDRPWWRPGPVLLTVLAIALAFVGWIAWLVGTRSVFHHGEGWRYEMEGRPTARPAGALEGQSGP